MRRFALVWVACLAGCHTSPVYVPGLHRSAPLSSKGSINASYVIKAPNGQEMHFAMLLTDRWFVGGGYSWSNDFQLVGSHIDLNVGRVTRDSSWQVQQSIGFTAGDSQTKIAGILDFFKYEGAPYMAFGNYSRLYVQQTTTRMFGLLEVGGSARLSAVRVTNYRRKAGTVQSNGATGGPYNRDTTFTGNLQGIFAEPALFFGLNFQGIRVTPQLSFAMPLSSTAFGAMPGEVGVTFAVDSDFLKRWSR